MIIPFDGENKEWGLPYHGLWSAGNIALPNGTNKTHPNPHSFSPIAEGYGTAWLCKRPGWTAPTRTTAEAAVDTATGRQWLNYALRSGNTGMIGGVAVGVNSTIYFDGNGNRWLVGLSGTQSPRPPDTGDPLGDRAVFSITIKKFGHFDNQTHSTATKNVTLPSGVTLPASTSYGPGDGAIQIVAAKSDGSQVIMGRPLTTFGSDFNAQFWPRCFWQVDISGTGDELATDFGLSFTITIIQDDNVQTGTGTATSTYTGQAVQVTTTFGGTSSAQTVPSVSMTAVGDVSENHVVSWSMNYKLWAVYDAADSLKWVEQFIITSWSAHNRTYYTQTQAGHYLGPSSMVPFQYTVTTEQGPSGSNVRTGSTTYGFRFDGAILWSRTFDETVSDVGGTNSFSSDVTTSGWNPALTPIVDSGTVTDPFTAANVFNYSYSFTGIGAPPVSRNGWYDDGSTAFDGVLIGLVRYSYQLIGLIRLPSDNLGNGPYHVGTLVDAWAPGAHTSFSITSPANYGSTVHNSSGTLTGTFGTWHPVTGTIHMDTTPVCWV